MLCRHSSVTGGTKAKISEASRRMKQTCDELVTELADRVVYDRMISVFWLGCYQPDCEGSLNLCVLNRSFNILLPVKVPCDRNSTRDMSRPAIFNSSSNFVSSLDRWIRRPSLDCGYITSTAQMLLGRLSYPSSNQSSLHC